MITITPAAAANAGPNRVRMLTEVVGESLQDLFTAALAHRPAVIAPVVTRPSEPVLDRGGLGLAPADAASKGVYALREASGRCDATIVLQGSAVTYAFVQQALPLLLDDGIDVDVFYVASAELFDALAPEEQERRRQQVEHRMTQ